MSYQEDREFEATTIPYFTDELETIVYPHSKCSVGSDKYDNKALDQGVSLDLLIKRQYFPTQSVQVKCRRGGKYKYFLRKRDIVLNIGKIADNGKKYEGDYYKCQANLFMYGYANADKKEHVTKLLYWVLIDYNKLRDKFFDVGGYKNIPGVVIHNYRSGSLVTQFMVIPWEFISDCIVAAHNKELK